MTQILVSPGINSGISTIFDQPKQAKPGWHWRYLTDRNLTENPPILCHLNLTLHYPTIQVKWHWPRECVPSAQWTPNPPIIFAALKGSWIHHQLLISYSATPAPVVFADSNTITSESVRFSSSPTSFVIDFQEVRASSCPGCIKAKLGRPLTLEYHLTWTRISVIGQVYCVKFRSKSEIAGHLTPKMNLFN